MKVGLRLRSTCSTHILRTNPSCLKEIFSTQPSMLIKPTDQSMLWYAESTPYPLLPRHTFKRASQPFIACTHCIKPSQMFNPRVVAITRSHTSSNFAQSPPVPTSRQRWRILPPILFLVIVELLYLCI